MKGLTIVQVKCPACGTEIPTPINITDRKGTEVEVEIDQAPIRLHVLMQHKERP